MLQTSRILELRQVRQEEKTAEEKKAYGTLLKDADPDGFGAVSGDIAVKFFERTKLPPDVLGQVDTTWYSRCGADR